MLSNLTGLIYLPAIVSVTMYFEKYRSLATGIAVCGAGFGTFIFAPLTETLISNYSWREAMLVIAGIVFTCVIFGSLFRPLKPVPKTDKNLNSEMRKFRYCKAKCSTDCALTSNRFFLFFHRPNQ